MNGNEEHLIQSATGPLSGQVPLQLRGPADMAEMLPYLLGFFPDDSVVAVGLQGPTLQQGGVIRFDIPTDPSDWPSVAADTARLLVKLSEQRDKPPEQVLLYLCRDPAEPPTSDGPSDSLTPGEGEPTDGPEVRARLAPLAEQLAQAFRAAGVLVKESLLVCDGRWWSFLCAGAGCCDPAGVPIRSVRLPSPIAAAATFAGVAPRGSRKAIAAGLAPIGPPQDEPVRLAIEQAGPQLIHALSRPGGRSASLERTAALLAEVMTEFGAGARELDHARTARLLVGLQDKLARDRGAEYAEPDELIPAQRLWRYLARHCVAPFEHYAAPPLTLLAWTSWLAGDSATARVVLARVLDLDQGYTLAQLLYESLNGGLHPAELYDRVRQERRAREQLSGVPLPGMTHQSAPPGDPEPPGDTPPSAGDPPAPPGSGQNRPAPADRTDSGSGPPGVPRQADESGRSGRPPSSRKARRKARRTGRASGGGPAAGLPDGGGPVAFRPAVRPHRPQQVHQVRRAHRPHRARRAR